MTLQCVVFVTEVAFCLLPFAFCLSESSLVIIIVDSMLGV